MQPIVMPLGRYLPACDGNNGRVTKKLDHNSQRRVWPVGIDAANLFPHAPDFVYATTRSRMQPIATPLGRYSAVCSGKNGRVTRILDHIRQIRQWWF